MSPNNAEKEIEGMKVKEPAFGMPAVWIRTSTASKRKMDGYTR